jgi:hypothetical protein
VPAFRARERMVTRKKMRSQAQRRRKQAACKPHAKNQEARSPK